MSNRKPNLSLSKRWANLPIGLKLRISILAVLLLALGLTLYTVQSALAFVIFDNARQAQAQQVVRATTRLRTFLETTTSNASDLTRLTDSAIQDYLLSRTDGRDTSGQTSAMLNVGTTLLNRMTALNNFVDVRFLDASGQQVGRAYRSSAAGLLNIAPPSALTNESAKAYFPALMKLTAGRLYLAEVSALPASADGSVPAQTLFQMGTPVYHDGAPAGVLMIGISANNLLNNLIGQPSPTHDYTLSLFDDGRQVLASANMDDTYLYNGVPFQTAEPLSIDVFKADQQTAQTFDEQIVSSDVVNVTGLNGSVKWYIVVNQNRALIFANLIKTAQAIFIPLVLIFLGVIALTYLIARTLTHPLRDITAAARRVAAGDLGLTLEVRGEDEIGQMSHSLNAMVQQAALLIGTLESRVVSRTRDMEIASQISRDAAALHDIDELLQNTVNAIRDQFDFYHVQVFLVDDNHEYAVLITSTGEAGRQLLQRKHKLGVGSASIIGQVTEKGNPSITLDTENSDVPHYKNPLLPDTRSEMALPLRVGSRTIGALDVQSVKPNAFDESNIQVFQVLADQLAVAVDNSRLLNETQQSVQQVADLNRQLTQTSWRDFVQENQKPTAFQYDMLNVKPLTLLSPDAQQISAEIRVRGESIGSLSAIQQPGRVLNAEDRAIMQAVADRVALAIENARLVQRTQSALAEIERLYQASRALGSAPDLEAVYAVAADQATQLEQVDRLVILRAGPQPVPNPQWLTYTYVFDRHAHTPDNPAQIGQQVSNELYQIIRLLAEPNKPYIMNDLEELKPYEAIHRVTQGMGIQSLILAPMTVGLRWFGLMIVQSRSSHAFTERFVQFVTAIADQLAIAIENRQLFEEAQAEARRNRALAEAAQVSSKIGVDFKEGITNLLQVVAAPAGIDRWWFGQLNDAHTQLECIISHFAPDAPNEALRVIDLTRDYSAISEATRLDTPVLVNDADHYTLTQLPGEVAAAFGKHLALPIHAGKALVGALLVGRSLQGPDFDEYDLQLVSALGSQLAVAMENRRLFDAAEDGRQTLQSVLDSLPTGVVVVDGRTRQISLFNAQAAELIGVGREQGFTISSTIGGQDEDAQTYRSDSFPPNQVLLTGQPIYAEDLVVTNARGEKINMLVNAAPIYSAEGELVSAVAVFTDTTELRELEATLQDNLRDTTSMYEASRLISAQESLPSVLEIVMAQIHQFVQPDFIFAVFQNDQHEISYAYQGTMSTKMTISEWSGALPFPSSLLSEVSERFAEYVPLHLEAEADSALTQTVMETAPQTVLETVSSFPLKARNRTIGWLILGHKAARKIAIDERRFLASITDQAAVAAESARLADETAQALRQTETLYLASRSINSATTISEAASVMRDEAQRLNPDRIDVFILTGRTLPERVEWLVRWEAKPPSTRATLILDESYITDMELLTQDALFVEDIHQVPLSEAEIVRRLPLSDNIMAQMSVPLRVKGSFIGRLVVSFFRPRKFSSVDRQFISTLTEQASVIIDNVVLYRQSQESLEETATLYQASRAVADATDDTSVLKAIIDHAVPLTVSRAMLVKLIGDDWETHEAAVEVVADWSRNDSFSIQGMHFTSGQFPAWKELTTPDILWVDSVMEAPQLSEDAQMAYLAFDISAFVMVPLIASSRSIGALLIASAEPREHSERELRMYTSLADQAAISMENRSLLRQAETRARQLSTSAEVGQAATSILNLDELLDKTVNLIRQSFDYDQVQIFLISPDGRNALLQASTGEAGRQLLAKQHSLRVGSASVIGRVTSTGKLYNVLDTADATATHRPNPYLPNTRSELGLPLVAKGRVVGALDVQSNQPGAFREEDERVLGTLADQVAVAIDNARLFEQNAQRIEEVRFLFNVTRTAAAVEIDVALSRVTRQILESMAADLVVFMLLDDEDKRLTTTYAAREGAKYIIPSSIPVEVPMIRQIIQSRAPKVLDTEAGQRFFSADDVSDLPSQVLVPLLAGDNFVGALLVGAVQPELYTLDALQLLQTLSSTLSAIVQNARLLRAVQEANQRLREVDKLKSQFLANMSHELRTPLNSIIGFSRVILKGIDGPLNDVQSQDLSTIHESGKHLLSLVNDILDQAKIEAGKMELSLDFFNPTELIKSVMSTAVGLVKDKPIRLHQELQPALPNVYADEFRTRQVLLNMLSNAAKFTRQGSITISAFVVDDGGQPMIQMSVTDTGIGISRENMRRVFAQFEQVDNSTARGAEGTGLGMPIAKSLIELQGGRIWVESEPGIGSTFSITVPTQSPQKTEQESIETANADLEAQVEQVITQAETPNEREHRIIVVVDDEAGMISLYRRYLVKAGYEVIGTTNPDEAPDLVINYQPHVILLDVNMPRRTGWEVLQQLKEKDETFQFPVVICSIEDNKPRGYQLGAADYLIKPFLEEDLVSTVRRIELERDLPSVLIIDNQPESLRLMREALTAKEDVLRVLEASTGDQGLDMISSHRPDLVILDLRMPGRDGVNVLEQIRTMPKTASQRVLVVTAADLSSEERARLEHEHVALKVDLSGDALLECVKQQLELP